jgi:hypothetical protein
MILMHYRLLTILCRGSVFHIIPGRKMYILNVRDYYYEISFFPDQLQELIL